VAEGFVHTIAACGDVLERHFPAGDRVRNELPDHLVELP
jgi:putative membrane protein